MFSVRLHGRGGQGVVTAAELLSVAAFLDGHESQAFPSFGSERMGAPVMSFCRVSDRPIRVREPVSAPDAVVVADATLLHHVDVFAGLTPTGFVLVNSAFSPVDLGLADLVETRPSRHVISVPASDLAREHIGRPMPNICLLGALAALTGIVSLGALGHAVRERFPAATAVGNIRAAEAAAALVPEVARA